MIIRIFITLILFIMLIACLVYIAKTLWNVLCKAVGISSKTVNDIEHDDEQVTINNLPTLNHLNVPNSKVLPLPLSIKNQLEHINRQVATYESWKQTAHSQNETLCEDDFILSKLIDTHLPEMIDTYLQIQLSKQSKSYSQAKTNNSNHTQRQAVQTLEHCLADVEQRFDTVINNYESKNLESLEVMKRYLQARE